MGIFKMMKYEYGKNVRWCNTLTDMNWGGLQCLIRFSCHHVGWEDVTKPQNRGQAPKEILVFEQDFSKFEETLKDEVWEAWAGRLEENGRLDFWIGGMVVVPFLKQQNLYLKEKGSLLFDLLFQYST